MRRALPRLTPEQIADAGQASPATKANAYDGIHFRHLGHVCREGRQVAAERPLHARADLNLQGSTAARVKAQRGPKSGELLTLLLTPGRFRADKPSQDSGL